MVGVALAWFSAGFRRGIRDVLRRQSGSDSPGWGNFPLGGLRPVWLEPDQMVADQIPALYDMIVNFNSNNPKTEYLTGGERIVRD